MAKFLELLFGILLEVFRFFVAKKSVEVQVRNKELEEKIGDISDVLVDSRDPSLYSVDGLRQRAEREGRTVPKIRSVRPSSRSGMGSSRRRKRTDLQDGGT